jgi:hypothetical protein
MDGLVRLSRAELLPIATVTRPAGEDPLGYRDRVEEALRAAGVTRPRIKLLPIFKLGREAERAGPYGSEESLAGLDPALFDPLRLQCSACRAVTSQGVFVCPLLVDEPAARLGSRLEGALGDFPLVHGACYTCHVTGMTCSNG